MLYLIIFLPRGQSKSPQRILYPVEVNVYSYGGAEATSAPV